MVTRDQIVAEALEWIGTPLVWGQSAKGVGCDCVGWIFGVARELGLPEAGDAERFRRGYRHASPSRLLAGLESALARARAPLAGDILALRLPGAVQGPVHLAMLINDSEIVHSYGRKIDRVVRVPLGANRSIHSAWTWPSLGGSREY